MASLVVKNIGSQVLNIAVNKWINDNNSDWHKLEVKGKGDQHGYDRDDVRGFILVVKDPSEHFTTYPIKDRGTVAVSETGATQDGVKLPVLSTGTWS